MTAPHRALSNNSASYTEKPDFEAFLNEWQEMYKSKAGERGLFSRVASQKQAAKNGRRDATKEFGTNPCSEIILRPAQLCNLSEVVVRPDDTPESLMRKVRIATILGTLQATLTNFRYVRSIWRKNTEEERLLGVSLTGIMDNVLLSGRGNKEDLKSLLERMKLCSVEVNKEYAEMLGINQSTAITCIKPSGTVSQLVDSASGIHPRYSSYYIRRVRADSTDPLCDILKDAGVPWEADVMSKNALVFSFPKKAPEDAVVASEMSAKEQLELWEIYQDHWCEHKPSMTCYYRDTEFLEIGQWVYNKFDKISGISFLPYSDHVYKQAPYEPITKEEYEATAKNFPTQFNWDLKEQRDNTEGVQTLACVAGACEI
jgi:ribonucleoside-diphosphate reductase alpha chain